MRRVDWKQRSPIEVTESGIRIFERERQYEKASVPRERQESGSVTEERAVQEAKQEAGIAVRFSESRKEVTVENQPGEAKSDGAREVTG
jgi:hypothetical protein